MKIKFILLLTLILIIFYIDRIKNDSFNNIDSDDIIIIVWDEEFYYLNIKSSSDNNFNVYKIPLYLINDFFNTNI